MKEYKNIKKFAMNKWKGKKIRRKVRKVGKGKVLRRFRFKAVGKL